MGAGREITVTVIDFKRKFLYLRYVDEDGRQHHRSSGEKNRAKAERVAARWERELRDAGGIHISTDWAAFRMRYEQEHLSGLSVRTSQKAASVLNSIETNLKPGSPSDLTASTISKLVAKMRADGAEEATIEGHMAHLGAALRWGKRVGILDRVPNIPVMKRSRSKSGKVMKGRPLTLSEFHEMLEHTMQVVGEARAKDWIFFQRGLWLSGLRLEESLNLWWKRGNHLWVSLDGKYPMFGIPADFEKGNKDRLLPMAPEFADFLRAVPDDQRQGRVFDLPSSRGRHKGRQLNVQWASTILSQIGEAAGIVVDHRTQKYASAHDFRRSFGLRWAMKVMPAVLKELMRHESIETSMRYYVGEQANATAEIIWKTHTSGNYPG